MNDTNCACMNEECHATQFEPRPLIRETEDGFIRRIEVWSCRACSRAWLRYSVDHETAFGWARWYRGLISTSDAERLTPEAAPEALNQLEWHFYGGSFFHTAGDRAHGPVHLDGAPVPAEAA